jgi:drug/metabolite transporter (DMT)-like permease
MSNRPLLAIGAGYAALNLALGLLDDEAPFWEVWLIAFIATMAVSPLWRKDEDLAASQVRPPDRAAIITGLSAAAAAVAVGLLIHTTDVERALITTAVIVVVFLVGARVVGPSRPGGGPRSAHPHDRLRWGGGSGPGDRSP